MKKNDFILIIIILFLAAAVFIFFRVLNKDSGTEVLITIDGEEYERQPLDKNIIIEIPYKESSSRLEIKDGHVDMISADCPDQVCVNHKTIHYNKESIVCLPGKIIVEIIHGEDLELDAVSE